MEERTEKSKLLSRLNGKYEFIGSCRRDYQFGGHELMRLVRKITCKVDEKERLSSLTVKVNVLYPSCYKAFYASIRSGVVSFASFVDVSDVASTLNQYRYLNRRYDYRKLWREQPDLVKLVVSMGYSLYRTSEKNHSEGCRLRVARERFADALENIVALSQTWACNLAQETLNSRALEVEQLPLPLSLSE